MDKGKPTSVSTGAKFIWDLEGRTNNPGCLLLNLVKKVKMSLAGITPTQPNSIQGEALFSPCRW